MNSVPHIGHAFEFILADAIAKWLKIHNTDVHFNVGLDEHGLKVWEKSQELGITPEEHINNLTKLWKEFCVKFDIKYDSFYKTSDKVHHEKSQIVWNNFVERGDIYKKSYRGNYCIGCESFISDKELVGGKCLDHPTTEIKSVDEENYFFRLSKYKDQLLNWINNNPEFLEPKSKLDELKNLIVGSDDISISRIKKNCPWGIDIPNDIDQVIYCWFEALWNYAFSAGYLTDNFKWDNVIQLCGPDNLRFQAVILQSFLLSEGLKNTDKLLVHGTILDKDGRKISKTLGNVVDPIEQLEKYGIDAVRYYVLAGLNTYSNSSWNEDELIRLFNSEICSGYGNLITRTLHLIDTKIGGNVISADDEFIKIIDNRLLIINSLWADFKVKEVCEEIYRLVQFGNKYINDTAPWNLEDSSQVLSNLYYLITVITKSYEPIFSEKCEEIYKAILNKKKSIVFSKIV